MAIDARFVGGPYNGQVRLIPHAQPSIEVHDATADRTAGLVPPGGTLPQQFREGTYWLRSYDRGGVPTYHWTPARDFPGGTVVVEPLHGRLLDRVSLVIPMLDEQDTEWPGSDYCRVCGGAPGTARAGLHVRGLPWLGVVCGACVELVGRLVDSDETSGMIASLVEDTRRRRIELGLPVSTGPLRPDR